MAQVNCYLPDELKADALEELPDLNWSELLRRGVVDALREARLSAGTGDQGDGGPSPAP